MGSICAKDLSQYERYAFIRTFLELWENKFEFTEKTNDAGPRAVPWSMPWHAGQDVIVSGKTPEEMAQKFFKEKLKNR